MPLTPGDCCKMCCSLIIPPIGVFMEKGCSQHLVINILLTLLGYIPGLIHACYIICKY
ncbi:Pmp3 domain containing protein [Trichuris trichiura]|uniref:Pmp3 domain containing protein n=1 Tax=Trichuris trichiura TaxID=36087 RepID=A0A077Z418_TRITR|nr:Pmp3 domain containing protein [Trichuris trichiura]